jgi:predicted transcriptional regulator YdeE
VYFAGMIFVKKRLLGLIGLGLGVLSSCQNGKVQEPATGDSTSTKTDSGQVAIADAGLLGSDTGIVVVEMNRKTTQLLGFWQQMPLSGVKEAIKTNAQLIVNRIVKDKYKMEGGLTVLYKEFPSAGSLDVFVGIPVMPRKEAKMPPLTDGFVVETVEAGSYVKATVNAEPGATLKSWEAFDKWMKSFAPNNGSASGKYPFFEYFQDSRNAEMTTTVGQAVLIMKKP